MSAIHEVAGRLRIKPFAGILPLQRSRMPSEIIAGFTLAALAIPEVMGYASIAGMAAIGSSEYVALAALLAPIVGLLLFTASAIGLGFMADFLSRTVLVGFLTGVGIQIALRAVSDLFGFHAPRRGTVMVMVIHVPAGMPGT